MIALGYIRPGVYDLGFDEYRADPAWGSSDLKAMRLGPPARVLHDREHPHRDTDATILGTAVHCLILTPSLYAERYVAKPAGMEFRSAENKAWRDGHLAAGRVILAADEVERIAAIREAIHAKPSARDALAGAKACEASIFWNDPATGQPCKGRPDFYDDEYVYDLKVTRDAGPRLAFKAYLNGWFHQLAHYRAGLNENGVAVRTGRILAVHPDAPHYVYCVEARVADLDVMALENERTLVAMKECREADDWPDTPNEWTRIEIPQYALQEAVALADAEEVDDA